MPLPCEIVPQGNKLESTSRWVMDQCKIMGWRSSLWHCLRDVRRWEDLTQSKMGRWAANNSFLAMHECRTIEKNTYSISCMCCIGWLVYIYILIHIPFIANWINSKLLKYKTTHPRLPQKKWFQSTCWQMSSWMSVQWKLLRHSTRWRSSVYRWTLNCFRGKEMKKRKETQHNIP